MKTTVAVFFGGQSVEHEVSIISGIQACYALNKNKYNVLPIYISKDNVFYTGEHMGDIESYKDMNTCIEKAVRVLLVPQDGGVALIRHPAKKLGSNLVGVFDVALPVVHGTNVEDGTLMGLLQMLGVPYTGCDVLSSALGMDKHATKAVLKQAGLPVLDCVTVTARQYANHEDEALNSIEGGFNYPLIVKPVNLGSSVGISLCIDRPSLKTAIDLALSFASRALIEPAVENLREINCSVLGDADEVQTSVCEEPVTSNEILEYKDKYLNNAGDAGGEKSGMSSLKRRLPAEISSDLEEKVRKLATQTFLALGCSGVVRIDFLNNKETDELYINEINTIPGSLSFYLWDTTGMDFASLLDNLIRLAFKRHREQKSLTFTYETNILSGVSLGGAKGLKGKA